MAGKELEAEKLASNSASTIPFTRAQTITNPSASEVTGKEVSHVRLEPIVYINNILIATGVAIYIEKLLL